MAPAAEISTPAVSPVRRKEGTRPLRRRQPPPEAVPQWRRALNFLLVFVTIVLVADALIGEKGLVETIRARRQSRELARLVDRLRAENTLLRGQIGRLRDDPRTIEAIARGELGLIKPGELLFILKDARPARR